MFQVVKVVLAILFLICTGTIGYQLLAHPVRLARKAEEKRIYIPFLETTRTRIGTLQVRLMGLVFLLASALMATALYFSLSPRPRTSGPTNRAVGGFSMVPAGVVDVIALTCAAFALLMLIDPARYLAVQRFLNSFGRNSSQGTLEVLLTESSRLRALFRGCGLIFLLASIVLYWLAGAGLGR